MIKGEQERKGEAAAPSGKLLAALILLAMMGVASLALARLAELAPSGVDPQTFGWLALVQPALLGIGAAFLGYAFAHRVGLDAPLLRGLLQGSRIGSLLPRQVASGLLGGIASGTVLLVYSAATEGAVPSSFELPLTTRLLYGGVAEEIIARWGLMSFVVWISWRIGSRSVPIGARHYWIGNITAALLFSLGHLPLLLALDTAGPPAWLIAAVLAGNMLPALIFGWLFARRGLEAAMLAHAGAHLTAVVFA